MKKGFSLVELLIVIAIISILLAIGIPSFTGYIKTARDVVCRTNCHSLERMYKVYLDDVLHSDYMFIQFKEGFGKDICPDNGLITYDYGKVKCNIHNDDGNEEDDVPYI